MISVIIPTYKRAKYINRAVQSVFMQSYKDIEVIVVDDNGTETQEQIETKQALIKEIVSGRVKYISHEKNQGGCAARNTGIKAAKGEFIALLDDDDEWRTSFLESLVKKMENPKVGAVYSKYYVRFDGKIYDESKKRINKKGNVYKDLLAGWCVASTSFFLLRKKYVDEVGGFDESLASFQDYDMWVRMARICEFDYVDEFLVIKEEGHSDEQVAFNPVRRKAGLDTLEVKMQKTLTKDEFLLFSPFIKKWRNEIKYNTVLRSKQRGEKQDYKNALKDYFETETRLEKRCAMIVTIILGAKLSGKIRRAALLLTGKLRRVNL